MGMVRNKKKQGTGAKITRKHLPRRRGENNKETPLRLKQPQKHGMRLLRIGADINMENIPAPVKERAATTPPAPFL